MKETWKHVPMHWKQGKFQLWAKCLDVKNEPWPQNFKSTSATHCCVERVKPILDRTAYNWHWLIDIFCICETWEHFFHVQQDKFQLWADCFMCWMSVTNHEPQSLSHLRNPLTTGPWVVRQCRIGTIGIYPAVCYCTENVLMSVQSNECYISLLVYS